MSRDDVEQAKFEANWKIEHCSENESEPKSGELLRSLNAESFHKLRRNSHSLPILSGVSNLAFNQSNVDHVTHLGPDRYMVRRRGTKIFVKGFPNINEEEVEEKKELVETLEHQVQVGPTAESLHSFSSVLSGLYAMLIVILAIVIKIAQFVTDDVTKVEVHWFFMVLFLMAASWLASYQPLATSCFKQKERIDFDKSNHVNNKWLKGVLALFGLAIIIKDGLEFIAFLSMDGEVCHGRTLFASLPVVHTIFILTQVNYLFKYSKVFTQDFRILTRFGVMHVVATNLSIWISTIADETAMALGGYGDSYNSTKEGDASAPHHYVRPEGDSFPGLASLSGREVRGSSSRSATSRASSDMQSILFSGNCACESSADFCSTIDAAEAFLFPFVIEFSLVASCLLYIIWTNIGKCQPVWEHVIMPSYKLYRSYAGVIAGALVLFATILIIVILGTTHSAPPDDRDYYSEIIFLNIYNGFYIALETLMIVACLLGFYLFKRIPHNLKKHAEELDATLLMICLVGPLLYGTFSILGVIAGEENKKAAWILSLGFPISDMLQCLVQVLFLLDGLKHEPIPSAEGQQTADEIEQRVSRTRVLSSSSEFEVEGARHLENDVFTSRSRLPSISSISVRTHHRAPLISGHAFLTSLKSLSGPTPIEEENQSESGENDAISANNIKSFPQRTHEGTSFSGDYKSNQANNATNKTTAFVKPQIQQQLGSAKELSKNNAPIVNDKVKDEKKISENKFARRKTLLQARASQPALKIIAETKVEAPDHLRLLLRNVTMFLLIANTCLWVFASLDHTAFVVYVYQSEYYGVNVWTIISMITRPLSIFFRMHSAACLFEVWSFA